MFGLPELYPICGCVTGRFFVMRFEFSQALRKFSAGKFNSHEPNTYLKSKAGSKKIVIKSNTDPALVLQPYQDANAIQENTTGG